MQTIDSPATPVELAIGLLMLVIIILVHGAGLRSINRRHNRRWAAVNAATARWKADLLLARVIGAFALLHLAETLMFALPLAFAGVIPSLRDSYFLVLESYTTLGAGDVQFPEQWRLLGPMIAMAGLFTFGWTGSSLVSVMGQFAQLDRDQEDSSDR